VIAAGEGDASGATINPKYDFWNSDLAGNLPTNHSYDLYLWAQKDSNTTSDTGSEPLRVTLHINDNSNSQVLPVSRGGTGENNLFKAAIKFGLTSAISKNSTTSQFPTARAVYQNPTTTLTTGYFKITKYTNVNLVKMQILPLTSAAWNVILGSLPEEYRPKDQAVYTNLLTSAGLITANFVISQNGDYSITSSATKVATKGASIIYTTKTGG
jgi:hypothetical protein